MHGKYPQRIKEADVGAKKINQWLKCAGLKAETKGLIIAAQDQSLATRSYHHHFIKDGGDRHCRLCACNIYEETLEYLVSDCPELAKTEYIQRHNKVATYLNWKICREYDIDTADKWYDHPPNNSSGKGQYHHPVRHAHPHG